MHMYHYKPDQHVLYEQRAVHDNNIMVGSYVAVLDTVGDANYHVVRVRDMMHKTALPDH